MLKDERIDDEIVLNDEIYICGPMQCHGGGRLLVGGEGNLEIRPEPEVWRECGGIMAQA